MQMILPLLMLVIIGLILLASVLMAVGYMIAALVSGIIHLVRFVRQKV